MGNATFCADQSRERFRSRATSLASSAAWSDVEDEPYEDEQVIESCLEVGVLCLDGLQFNPDLPQVRAKLLAALGASPAAHLSEFKGCYAEDTDKSRFFIAGNRNQGIWFMKDRSEQYVLKLAKATPEIVGYATETETFQKLYHEIPEIASDLSVAFPTKILKILGRGGARQYDLHVMRRVPGRSFDTIIESYWKNGKKQELMTVFRMIGEFLRRFHARYGGRQHCDVGPQNIFYNEVTKQVAIVDLGMMGISLTKSDVEMFSEYVGNLGSNYGPEILKGIDYFQQGYRGNGVQRTAGSGGLPSLLGHPSSRNANLRK